MKFFKRLGTEVVEPEYPRCSAPVLSVSETISNITAETLQRLSFTGIGIIMLVWSWTILTVEIPKFPNIDWFSTIIGLFTFFLGIRNALSIFKDVTWGQAYLTLLWFAGMVYLTFFL